MSRFVPGTCQTAFVNDVQRQELSSARDLFSSDLCHCPCERANLQDPNLIQRLGK